MPTSPNSLTIDGQAASAGVGEHVADQRRLAGAEKAGDDRAGECAQETRGDVVIHSAP